MTSTTLLPGPHMVLVMPSPVSEKEEQRESGLVVVRERTPEEEVLRGVVLALGTKATEEWSDLETNRTVYYTPARAYAIGDNVLLHYMSILAMEED